MATLRPVINIITLCRGRFLFLWLCYFLEWCVYEWSTLNLFHAIDNTHCWLVRINNNIPDNSIQTTLTYIYRGYSSRIVEGFDENTISLREQAVFAARMAQTAISPRKRTGLFLSVIKLFPPFSASSVSRPFANHGPHSNNSEEHTPRTGWQSDAIKHETNRIACISPHLLSVDGVTDKATPVNQYDRLHIATP